MTFPIHIELLYLTEYVDNCDPKFDFFLKSGSSQNIRIIDGQAYTYSLFFHSLPLYIVQNMRRALNFHEQDYIRYMLFLFI